MFKKIRILLLLFVLLFFALGAYLDKTWTTDWQDTIRVGVYPIAGDVEPVTRQYINDLDSADFASIEAFMSREVARYGVSLEKPMKIWLGQEISMMPPSLKPDANVFDNVFWSLRTRWWAATSLGEQTIPRPEIKIFVVYHDPKKTPSVPHSLGLEKGLIGVVYAFSGRKHREANNVVIAHEIFHTLGASDKYDFATGQPLYPIGYANADQNPLYPQRVTELMAGRRAISETEARMPSSLKSVLANEVTAAEIRLYKP